MSTNLAYAQCPKAHSEEFARDVLAGLQNSPKGLPCKYFYDDEGSRLFDLICALPEYYPTRTEIALLEAHAPDMAALIGRDVELVEFGAGSLRKVGVLLDALDHPRAYRPVDISGDYLAAHAKALARRYWGVAVRPIVADFTKPLAISDSKARMAGFFPGSTIGNFERAEALTFLSRAAKLFPGSGLLIGVDLVKDPAVLHAAYNDAAGVTEAFNKNILVRANRELDADFDPDAFAHYAFYDPVRQRVEMHLTSRVAQDVRIADETVAFAEGETIHTENSYKYTVDGFHALAEEAGFRPRAVWRDAEGLFSLHWLEA
ncbi:MAG TPA: L-histidine N(alpha)-methyltransferase [Rhizomicrobium sp.]|nr:L-histidine N(alpha)-methyltransferase [Rhizomicrobium sp.]